MAPVSCSNNGAGSLPSSAVVNRVVAAAVGKSIDKGSKKHEVPNDTSASGPSKKKMRCRWFSFSFASFFPLLLLYAHVFIENTLAPSPLENYNYDGHENNQRGEECCDGAKQLHRYVPWAKRTKMSGISSAARVPVSGWATLPCHGAEISSSSSSRLCKAQHMRLT